MNSLNFLYIALGTGFLVLVGFICVTLVHLIKVLKDINHMTDKASQAVEKVTEYVLEPLSVFKQIYGHIKPFLDIIQKKKDDILHNKKNKSEEEEDEE